MHLLEAVWGRRLFLDSKCGKHLLRIVADQPLADEVAGNFVSLPKEMHISRRASEFSRDDGGGNKSWIVLRFGNVVSSVTHDGNKRNLTVS